MLIAKLKNARWNLLAGILMILLGVFIWFNPLGTMMALAAYIGIGFFVVGAFYIMSSTAIKSGWYLLVGIINLLVGIILLLNLGVTAASLPVILALWCLFTGVVELIGAWDMKKYGLPWGFSAIMGGIGVVVGFLILAYPMIGAVTVSVVLGLYAILFGILQLIEYSVSKNSYTIYFEDK